MKLKKLTTHDIVFIWQYEVQNYDKAFKTLIALGFKRVLTRGGKHSAIKNIDNLKRLSDLYEDKIQIIVGGKIDFNNYKWIHDENKIE